MPLLRPQLQWRFALTFMFQHPHWKQTWFLIGLVFLLCPSPGWWIALGYRRRVGLNARFEVNPLLPHFKDCWRDCLWGGFQTLLVIMSYLCPIMLLYWSLVLPDLNSAYEMWPWILLFVTLITLLPPVFASTLPLVYLFYFDQLNITLLEALIMMSVTTLIIFPLPACFLNVSVTGKMRHVYRVDRAWKIILRQPRAYLEAWILSGCSTFIAGLTGPFMTWGYAWSYMVILSSFNQMLVKANPDPALDPIRKTLMQAPAS